MKKNTCAVFLSLFAPMICLCTLFATICVRADTPLTINSGSPFGCLQNAYLYPIPMVVTGSFTLPSASGTGTVVSTVPASAPTFGYPPTAYFYNYTIDLSHLSAGTAHCVRLLVHFGTPDGCGYDTVYGSSSAIQSASLAAFGDITFVFGSGCLSPGQPQVGFLMFSEAAPKSGVVTIIDDYFDPASGNTNETRINVAAIVPDIPPDPPPWYLVSSARIPYAWLQGALGVNNSNNPAPPFTNGFASGPYDFALQLVNAPSNSLASSQIITQTVQVANGLFNLPLPFDPAGLGNGAARWLTISVRPSGQQATPFTPIGPPLPITPAPQAYYAYTAGVVADLTPGQAVTSLNGLTDAVTLQAGNGINVGINGNTIVVSAAVGSDRNIKTDFTTVKPGDILAKLAALRIEGWRYTNETPGIRHVGPMAQDFKAAFGLGHDDKIIEYVDEQGVALAAIQGLNQKIETEGQRSIHQTQDSEARIGKLEAENAALKFRLEKLEQLIESKNGESHDDRPTNK